MTTNEPPVPKVPGYERVGYYGSWSTYGRNFQVKDIETSGQAAKLTVINYAFGNVDPVELTCLMTSKATTSNPSDPDEGTGAGDPSKMDAKIRIMITGKASVNITC